MPTDGSTPGKAAAASQGWTGPVDPAALTAALVRAPSVTPDCAAVFAALRPVLQASGFALHDASRGDVENLVAVIGAPDAGPTLAFNGHLDVVPPGDAATWRADPFSGAAEGGLLWGRGVVDMKSGVAAFVAAAASVLADSGPPRAGALALLITGDEEGPSTDGTQAILDWMAASGMRIDHCIVGEPTSHARLGDQIKIGRRGSLTAHVEARGVQGHVAYPDRLVNPLPALTRFLDRVASVRLDEGTDRFAPSSLQITTIDVGNPASNVAPAAARATLNIRFNDAQSSAALTRWLEEEAARAAEACGGALSVSVRVSGEAFATTEGPFTALVAAAVRDATGAEPARSTSGGTSDARFIKDVCPVVELGLVGDTMHQVDERAPIADIYGLAGVYRRVIERYFAAPPL